MGRDSGRPEAGSPDRAPATGERSRSTGNRLARRALLVGGGLLGLFVLLYGAAAVLVHLLLDPASLARWVEPGAEAALNRDVELEGARIRLFPHLGAELRGVRVSNLPDFEGPPLARIRAVRLQVAILPLFRRRVRVDEVRVEEPAIHLAVDAEGRTNYGDLVPESREAPAGEGGRPLDLAVREVTVRGGSLVWVQLADSVRLELSGLAADAGVERSEGGWSGEVRVGSDSLALRHPGLGADPFRLGGPAMEARGGAGPDFGWVEVREGALRVGAAVLSLTGRIEGLEDPVRRVDLSLGAEELDLSALLEALPEGASGRIPGRAGGTLGVDLRIEGSAGPESRPDVRGDVVLASIGLRGPEGEALIEDLGGRVEIAPDRVTVGELSGTVLGGPFSLAGTLRTDSALTFDARLTAHPRLDLATALAAVPEGVRLSGRIDASLRMAGAARRPGATRIDGVVEGGGLRLEHPEMGVPAAVEEVRLVFEGRAVRWSEVGVTLGEDRLVTGGSLDDPLAVVRPPGEAVPLLDAEVRGARLDLDAVLPPEGDPSVTYGRIAFAHLGDRAIQGRSAAEWAERKELALPDSLPVAGEARIRLDTLISAPYRLTGLEARVALAPALLEVPEARYVLYGGEVTTALRLGVGGGAPQPFTLALRAEGARAADFLAATSPLGRHVTGTLSLQLDVAGEVDNRMLPVAEALAGSGRARVRDGGLEENPLTRALADALAVPALASPSFDDWTAPFEVQAARLRFTEATLTATRLGPLRYGGAMGLDGSLDLGLRLALPAARLDSLVLGRSGMLSAVVGRLTGGEAPVAVGLAVGGTIQDPVIRPRASLATGELRRALEAEAEERTEALRDTARARLDQARDTAAARAEAERRRLEERARREAEEAREELEERARGLLRRLSRPRDTTAPGAVPPDSTAPGTASPDSSAPGALPRDTARPDTADSGAAAPDTATEGAVP